ncbi:MAG: LPP20 family lipoprotein [Campylobacterales bacterium]|nr:LPP20 family lipoprotein [Campylobacterales bacterium]
MVKVFFLLLVTFLFSGCVGGKKEVEVLTYPKFYTTIPQDSRSYYYGLGEGSSKEDAIAIALNDIASKLSITVESKRTIQTNISTHNERENYTQISNNEIKNEVGKVEFSSYEVKRYEQMPENRHFVLVAIDRVKNANMASQKIASKIDSYKKELSMDSSNIVSKLKALNKISGEINTQTLRECDVLKALSYSDEVDGYIKTLKTIDTKIAEYKNKITFFISADDAYKNVLMEKLSSKGYSVVDDGAKVNLHLYVLETQLYVMGNHIYKANIEITATADNKVVGKKTLTVGAKSRSNYEMARDFGVVEFRDKLEKESVLAELVGI